jgi:hypothetical protein
MRRVIAYLEWQTKWWLSYTIKQNLLPTNSALPSDISTMSPIERVTFEDWSRKLEGRTAYAYRQAHIRESMRQFCQEKWLLVHGCLGSMDGRDATIMVECH